MMAQTCNPSTGEVEDPRSLSYIVTWRVHGTPAKKIKLKIKDLSAYSVRAPNWIIEYYAARIKLYLHTATDRPHFCSTKQKQADTHGSPG